MKHRDFTRTFHVRSYSGKRLRNPFFVRESVSRAMKWSLIAAGITVPIALTALFVFAPFLRYRDIQVEGLTTLDTATVQETARAALQKRRFLFVPGAHLFFANEDRVLHALEEQYHFAHVELQRVGRALHIQAQERISEVAWIAGDQIALIDLTGIATREVTDDERLAILGRMQGVSEGLPATHLQPTMPLLTNLRADAVTIGNTVIETEKVIAILEVDAAARSRGLQPLRYTVDDPTSPWMTVQTMQLALLFDFNLPTASALGMFDAFHNERGNLDGLEYVDLRFGNHIYIKTH